MNVYFKIYALEQAIMELNYICFYFFSLKTSELRYHRFSTKLHVETTLIALQGHSMFIESLVTHAIIDKAAYLSKATMLRLLFLPLSLVSSCNQSCMNI